MDRLGPTGKVSTFWGGPLFPVGPVGIFVEWIAPVVHLKTRFFETFPVGPNRSVAFWTEISGTFGGLDPERVFWRERERAREKRRWFTYPMSRNIWNCSYFSKRPKNTALSWFRFDMSNLEKLWTFIRICRKLIEHGAATWRIFTRKWSSLALTPYISL